MKHIPTRTCIVCRQKDAKRGLTRLVRTPEARVVIDVTGKRPGRGAYICDRQRCWDTLLNSQLLDRALKATVSETEKKRIYEEGGEIAYGRENTNTDGH